ncbi:hypothetical protein O9G_005727 [Rozella allomycis CSF55]|uniref:Uncharacterized protein n=1 Tax=Rozella allomycis (strain CSF55) TaxID=988480 RepID=A0A075AV91_ROZAC|nr:hypothetical protein O9G_005727 [Rozella allomycis CSF55]|eukprot:EPZ32597.1 hypothetical protein O9G_005727 [Rozella allomycis CSF55]
MRYKQFIDAMYQNIKNRILYRGHRLGPVDAMDQNIKNRILYLGHRLGPVGIRHSGQGSLDSYFTASTLQNKSRINGKALIAPITCQRFIGVQPYSPVLNT